ncbi:MAG: MFS transporter [Lentisphaeria bacterium]|nr:MFS transporter [Lentisphaeria bacterium]
MIFKSKIYQHGNLQYTLPRLFAVSAFLILTNISVNFLAYKIVPNTLPLLLDSHKVSAKTMAVILSTIPSVLSFILCPIISTWSDRTRTRRGRRIPFLLFSTPLVVLMMLLIGFEPQISGFIHRNFFPGFQFNSVGTAVLAGLIILYQIVFLVPGSVYYYVSADVIPKDCLATFMAVSGIFSSGSTFFFNYFLLGPSVQNPQLWFPVIGGLYLVAFMLLCFFVKEREYPPVEDKIDSDKPFYIMAAEYVRLYFKECYSHKIYVMLFLTMGITQASNICREMFNLLFATKSLGMTPGEYGKVLAMGALSSTICSLGFGKLMDKTHPLWMFLGSSIIIIFMNLFGYFFVQDGKSFMAVGICMTLVYGVQSLAGIPLLVNIVPNEKFGQFASANSVMNCIIMIFASLMGGYVTDRFGYRVMFIWDFVLTVVATATLVLVIKWWRQLGGKKGYVAPKTW